MFSMANTVDFLNWLRVEMGKRGWDEDEYAELGRAADIHRQVIWGWFNRGKKPSPASLVKLAKTFRVDEDDIFRIAGVMSPARTKKDKDVYQIMNEVEEMNEQDRTELLSYIRWKKNARKK